MKLFKSVSANIYTLNILHCSYMLLLLFKADSQTSIEQINKLENNFLAIPNEYHNYEKLAFLISEHYFDLNTDQRMEIRKILSDNAHFSRIEICPPGEVGIPISIRGIVHNQKGSALKNVKILVFHTDASGYYAPDDSVKHKMNEHDSRLFGYIVTDELGRYEFHTIHPGTYPNSYQGRFIPQHIHVEINHPGYQNFSIQMAFEDDPAMKDSYWQEWAIKLKYPVIQFKKVDKWNTGNYDITLIKD